MMSYEEAVAYLSTLQQRGWRLGLDRMEAFLRAANLDNNLGSGMTQYLHVAGTNGKGSVTAYLQSILVEAGYATGAFFSPYVVDLRERVQFGREFIGRDDFARHVSELAPIAAELEAEYGCVTEFEMKTAVGVRYWTERQCAWVALEVGLGGRLDATNVVTPAGSGIVSIGYDHTAILGGTLSEIATEKAGIIKPGRPVVSGDLPSEALDAVGRRVDDSQAPWWRWGREVKLTGSGPFTVETPGGTFEGLTPGLVGAPQPHNMAVAIAMAVVSGAVTNPEAIRRGVVLASLPGRFQRLSLAGHTFILDGAHNAESALQLRTSLEQHYPGERFTLITGMVDGHEPEGVMAPLRDVIERTYVAPIDFYRALPPEKLAPYCVAPVPCATVGEALDGAVTHTNPILVTGSFYLVGDVLRTLEARRGVD
ncbi:MAG: bifunctional folylpolyglutamate synthase/dihydrofolate synthase [Methanoregulaceae archaeon]|nr:bifunctional folylpolyglutamate synthase/dihydrofolate synthase [Methanoregulaceae archaeon]